MRISWSHVHKALEHNRWSVTAASSLYTCTHTHTHPYTHTYTHRSAGLFCLSIHSFIHLSIKIPSYLFIHLYISIMYPSISYLSSIYSSIYLFIHLLLVFHLSVSHLSIHPSSIYLFIYPYLCLISISIFVSLSLSLLSSTEITFLIFPGPGASNYKQQGLPTSAMTGSQSPKSYQKF